ncbi:hypothetical protein [Aurantibacillus circumpalustris]|uniref:hypothetical protein n=1 Tax=Aurantibacillus circumpalustris TaxID=3036359 RepID=UPI00295BE5AD|nr:hypothetical protein [Aurantibacillus circumpalustris]
MKTKLFLAVTVLVVLNTACKKDVTCECTETTTQTQTGQNGTTTQTQNPVTTTTTYKNISKSDLGTLCGDRKYSNTYNNTSNGQTTTSIYDTDTKCKIK